MKYKAIPYFSIILILLIPANVFGDSVNISVDLPIFTDTDKIVIFGSVSTEITLQVMITGPGEIVILNEDITISAGDFTHNIVIGDYDLGRSGHYDISVSYNESKIIKQFFYDSGHNVNPMKVDGTIESLTESEQMIVFAIAATIIISVLIFLARGSIFRKKSEYDTNDWASKKNRDYEKYHSEWMSDEQEFSGKEKKGIDENEFLKSLQGKNIPDYYGILEIQKNASQSEIKKQFRTLAKKWHPDKKHGPDAEKKMAEINMAYGILSNQKNRKLYDQYYQRDDTDDKH